MKLQRTHTFAMTEKSNAAILYLKKEKTNLSALVQRALLKEMERQELIKKLIPES